MNAQMNTQMIERILLECAEEEREAFVSLRQAIREALDSIDKVLAEENYDEEDQN